MIKEIQLWYHILKILEEYGILGAVKGDVYGYFKRRMLCVILGDARKKVPVPHYYMRNIEQIKGKKIVIWGAGRVGQDYYLQISKYQNCRIAAWIDSNWEKYHYDYAEVSAAENISFIPCDLIIIAVKEKDMGMEIRDRLAVYGISVEKIIWQKPGEYY